MFICMTSEVEYVSLGSWCLTSHMLKLAKVKKASYPLDWVFSNQEMIENLFNNINIFESTQLTSKEGKTTHKKYGTIFNHHDPLYDANDYAYFQRCIQRFEKLYEKDVIYFILILTHEVDEEKLERLLSSKISNCKLIIFDKSYSPKQLKFPDFKVSSIEYSVEDKQKITFGDDDEFFYGIKEEK